MILQKTGLTSYANSKGDKDSVIQIATEPDPSDKVLKISQQIDRVGVIYSNLLAKVIICIPRSPVVY